MAQRSDIFGTIVAKYSQRYVRTDDGLGLYQYRIFMKAIMNTNTWAGVIAFNVFILFIHGVAASGAIIIDHTCTDISKLPEYWINKAKNDSKISYGHTSHRSQIITGMNLLKGASGSLYWFDHNGTDGCLSLHDYEPSGDLGNPDRTTWATRTHTLLNNPDSDRNLIMWSWCGQVSYATESDINIYHNRSRGYY